MVGARTLAMAINRLVDAEIDARNPRTAGRELPAGQLSRLQVGVLCVGRARRLPPRRREPHRGRPLAVADSRGDVRGLPVPQALHLVVPRLARRGARARPGRGLGRADRLAPVAAVGTGRRGLPVGRRIRSLLRAPRPRARRRGRPDVVGDPLRGRRRLRRRESRCTRARSPSSRSSEQVSPSASGTGSASRSSARCSSTSTGSSEPDDLRRLDAAFFTVNGALSIAFCVTVALDTLL